jgi:hypothetical protein
MLYPKTNLILQKKNLYSFYYDLKAPIIFELVFLNIVFIIIHVLLTSLAFDGIYFATGFLIGSILKCLGESFQKAVAEQNFIEIRRIFKTHQEVLELFSKFNKLYAPLLLVKYWSVILSICISGYKLVVVRIHIILKMRLILFLFSKSQEDSFAGKANHIIMLFLVLIGIFVYSVIGTVVTTQVILSKVLKEKWRHVFCHHFSKIHFALFPKFLQIYRYSHP